MKSVVLALMLASSGPKHSAHPLKHKISEFRTLLVAAERSRNANVRLAASKLNGVIIRSGEVLSFNEVVGERSEEAGYGEAPTYTDFGRVIGIGGGICQLAGTLYNAALMANLQVVERHAHGMPVRYVSCGRDATVSPVDDLKILNNSHRLVRLTVQVTKDTVVCAFEASTPLKEIISIVLDKQKLPDGSLSVRAYREIRTANGQRRREALSDDVYAVPLR